MIFKILGIKKNDIYKDINIKDISSRRWDIKNFSKKRKISYILIFILSIILAFPCTYVFGVS